MLNNAPRIEAKKQESLIEVMVISGAVAFAVSVISPTLTYLVLCGIGYRMMTSYDYWKTFANQSPANFYQPDNMAKAIMGVAAFTGLLFFYQFSLLSQMILAGIASAGLSAVFIDKFVVPSQNALNRALKTAVTRSERETTTYLLRRGADPYFQDDLGNTAFHDAVQNHRDAPQVLQILKTPARQIPDFLSIFEPPHDLVMGVRAQDLWRALINCRDFTEGNRAILLDSTKNLLREFYHYLAHTTYHFVLYYRNKIAYPKDIHTKNNAGQTPADLLGIVNIDNGIRPSMAQWLEAADPMSAPSAPVPIGARGGEVLPRFAPSAPTVPVRRIVSIEEVKEDDAKEGKERKSGPRT